ncbi:acetolactate synthase large subunit biosynthetic type [Anopheles sinensis]|uniref:Acetolactate synthase large subunit biosynthetic type n=1 Tax=Anopheles sinensis TaxID=74873 RepID=A0A084W3U2_ANOSI|nr:acetolactate synthase large subunit biosynthetic type [Anopheles sinensis]
MQHIENLALNHQTEPLTAPIVRAIIKDGCQRVEWIERFVTYQVADRLRIWKSGETHSGEITRPVDDEDARFAIRGSGTDERQLLVFRRSRHRKRRNCSHSSGPVPAGAIFGLPPSITR